MASVIEQYSVPAASTLLLALLAVAFGRSPATEDPLWLAAFAIAALAGLLGLTVGRTRAALEGSTAHHWLVVLLAPPAD